MSTEFAPAGGYVVKFWSLVEKASDDECWMWVGVRNRDGYGHFHCGGKLYMAHRFSVLLAGTSIPDGYEVDHLCRNRSCVNPGHLEPVTRAENGRRGFSVPAINARKTHCKRGHEFTPENTRSRPGGRECLACVRIHTARYRAKVKARIEAGAPMRGAM